MKVPQDLLSTIIQWSSQLRKGGRQNIRRWVFTIIFKYLPKCTFDIPSRLIFSIKWPTRAVKRKNINTRIPISHYISRANKWQSHKTRIENQTAIKMASQLSLFLEYEDGTNRKLNIIIGNNRLCLKGL